MALQQPAAVRALPRPQRQALTLLYGLDGRSPRPPETVAAELRCSVSFVAFLERAALLRLRRAARTTGGSALAGEPAPD